MPLPLGTPLEPAFCIRMLEELYYIDQLRDDMLSIQVYANKSIVPYYFAYHLYKSYLYDL